MRPSRPRSPLSKSIRCFARDFGKQCYTAPFPHMVKTAPHRFLFALLLQLLSMNALARQNPSSPVSAAEDLVQQILSRSGSPSAVAVSFQNVSAMPGEKQETAQTAIFNAFRAAGVSVVKPERARAEVQVIFSEDWQGYLWIGVIHQGSTSQTVIRKLARPAPSVPGRVPELTLRKNPVWQQDDPILDFYVDNQNLVVLEPDQISMYTNDSGQWRGRYTLAVVHDQAWPRDLRGRLKVSGGQISAFLPGTYCEGSLSQPSLECRASDDPWQVDHGQIVAFYSPRRNFFSGILSGPSAGSSVFPFFSGAAWPNGDQRQWLFAGTDGRVRLYQNDLSSPAAVFSSWGSNLAGVHSNCGLGWQMVVTGPTDGLHPDSIQVVEIAGREAEAASSALDLTGPVTALWTSGRSGEAVNAVVKSTVTGRYEAFTLTVACN